MPDFYSPLPQIQVPNGMNTLGSMLNLANSAQQLRLNQMNVQQKQATLPADIAGAQAASAKAQAEANVATQTQAPKIQQAGTEAETAATALKQKQLGIGMQTVGGLLNDPDVLSGDPDKTVAKLAAARDQMEQSGTTKAQAEWLTSQLISKAHQPGAVVQTIRNLIQSNAGPQAQAGVVNAPLTPVAVGNAIQPTQLQPGAPGAVPPNQPMTIGLPPTTVKFDPSGQASYLGPNGGTSNQWVGDQPTGNFQGNPQQIAAGIQNGQLAPGASEADRAGAMQALQNQVQGQGKPVLAGAPPGVLGAVGGTVDTVNKDWDNTVLNAKPAGTDIGLLENLKKFAPGAVTGVETDRRAYVAGLAGLLHMSEGELAKTNTDLLAKNTNMLALAGGDTNLARTMAEGANPNTHMTAEAIEDAANQVIGQRKLALGKMEILGPIKAAVDRGLIGPDAYNAALAKINSIDPRVFQLSEMNDAAKKKMMGAMTSQQQDDFINMTRTAHALGFKP